LKRKQQKLYRTQVILLFEILFFSIVDKESVPFLFDGFTRPISPQSHSLSLSPAFSIGKKGDVL
jgi:hypothetical protein